MKAVLTYSSLLLLLVVANMAAPKSRRRNSIEDIFRRANITPLPDRYLNIDFGEGPIKSGDLLCPTEMIDPPTISFDSDSGDSGCHYAFLYINLDRPFPDDPFLSPSLGALYYIEKPGDEVKIDIGDACRIATWIAPTPPAGGGTQRIVFYVIKLRENMDKDDPELQGYQGNRGSFPLENFINRYSKGNIYANYLVSKYGCECEEN